MKPDLILPMFAMVILTLAVGIKMLLGRVRALKAGEVPARYFKTYSDGTPTDEVLKASRHFSNLFELPLLFYVGCILAILLNVNGFWIQFWAWLFVAARIGHAIIHLGSNKIIPRLSSYLLGWMAVLGIWIHLLV